MTKPTKLQTLTESLEVARKALSEAEVRLHPQIKAEQAVVDGLRAAADKADKAHRKAYEAFNAAERNVRARLFPAEASKQLRAAIKAHVGEKFPLADVERLAKEYESAQVAADPEYAAAKTANAETYKAQEKARIAWNVATNPGSKLSKLQRELESFHERVERLEKEIERLPRYRQAAKDRRAEERQDALVHDQTQAARELLAGFRFEGTR